MKMEGLTFPKAVRQVAHRYGIEIPETENAGGPSVSERDGLYRANQFAADFFERALWKSDEGARAHARISRRAELPPQPRAHSRSVLLPSSLYGSRVRWRNAGWPIAASNSDCSSAILPARMICSGRA